MNILKVILFLCFFFSVNANDLINDEDYYNKGVEFYDDGAFNESFIVFFNLSEKGHNDSIFNLTNMYYEGVGTIQNFKLSLKYCWLCVLNGNKKCLQKVDKIKDKLSEKIIESVANEIPEILEKFFVKLNNPKFAFKLGFWHEKISPIPDLEQSYLWYSVSVSSGVYKAMKLRDRVGKEIEVEKIDELQNEAKEIITKNKYFNQQNTEENI